MPILQFGAISLDYSVYGNGHPLTLFAPGGMNSVASMWKESPAAPGKPMPWIDPTVSLVDHFQVVAMDQRNAGGSSAPVSKSDSWSSFAADQTALVDHLGLGRTHLMGGCIGSSYCLGFIQADPARVTAAVLQNPIGLTPDNRDAFYKMFDGWATQLRARRPEVGQADLDQFRENMFGGEFVFSVTREFVRSCKVPLLVLAGSDHFHPPAVAEEIADLAPKADLMTEWAGPEHHAEARSRILEFLQAHTPPRS